jgi:hypothetical protein
LAILSQSTKCSVLRKQYLKYLNFCLNILYFEKQYKLYRRSKFSLHGLNLVCTKVVNNTIYIYIRIDIPYLEKRTLRGRYSNSLVIDSGSQFSLRACSQATSFAKRYGPSVNSFRPRPSMPSYFPVYIYQIQKYSRHLKE